MDYINRIGKLFALTFCSSALLVACGGGGGDYSAPPPSSTTTPPATEQVPSAVGTSVSALVDYLAALIAASADMLEPVDVSSVTPAVDDGAEPSPVN